MKRIDRLILKSFIGPLLLTFSLAVFVLLMQFVWKYIDDIAGKGLSVGIIAELMLDASATFVPMALPIAVLFASIMTMGNLGERYELVAVKAGGIPLWRAMMPMLVVVMLLTGVAYLFADYVMPSAVLKYRTTLYDITRKKPALNIRPGEYYSEIDGYVIRVNEKDRDGHTLHDITIYDHRANSGSPDVVVARRGTMQTTPDERYMLFSLYDGCSYSEVYDDAKPDARAFTRVRFDTNQMPFALSEYAINKPDETLFKGGYQMMNTQQLDTTILRLEASLEKDYSNHFQQLRLRDNMPTRVSGGTECTPQQLLSAQPEHIRKYAVNHARSCAEQQRNNIKMFGQISTSSSEYINRHYIEWHRKFTLSLACIVLFFVGAPFGSIVRKGGLGMPLVASVVFFVIYYVVGMIVEKAVRESAIGNIGMWVSTFVMLPIGIFLTYRAVKN